jgi:hypothetical protein
MVMGAPLEDARHLAQRYDRMRQEAEAQVISICISLLHNKFTFTFCFVSLYQQEMVSIVTFVSGTKLYFT